MLPVDVIQEVGPDGPGLIGSLVLGVVEGLTEFLPISSTGHLIVTNRLLGQSDPTYEVAIQAGAITAIAVLYWRRLWDAARTVFAARTEGRINLLLLLLVAAVPAAVVGLSLGDLIEAHLFSAGVVAATMVLGGVALLGIEAWLARRGPVGEGTGIDGMTFRQAFLIGLFQCLALVGIEAWLARRGPVGEGTGIDGMTFRQAFLIGLFQCLALVPGTSRSGATIAGALLLGFRRTAAAEFSFLVGLPILYGACVLKTAQDWERISGPLLGDFLVGAGASFVTALVIVGPFVRFLQRHTFAAFAWYRIVAGLALAGLIAGGLLDG